MEVSATQDTDKEIQDQMILLAASNHDIETLRMLLRKGSASVQDPETGFTPLHAAIAACEDIEPSSNGANGAHSPNEQSRPQASGNAESQIQAAARTMKLLLINGAIWNDVDRNARMPCS